MLSHSVAELYPVSSSKVSMLSYSQVPHPLLEENILASHATRAKYPRPKPCHDGEGCQRMMASDLTESVKGIER